jgi:hypothetical protein
MFTETLTLEESPRLFVSKDTALHLNDKLHSPFLRTQAQRVLEDADWIVRARPVAETEGGIHYPYGGRSRIAASHLQCLTAAWVLTGAAKYRKAGLKHLANLMNWNHISCVARHNTPAEVEMPFCLSYGEHAADIALMYDLFRPEMTAEEQQVFFDVLDRFYMKEAVKCLHNPPWWAFQSWSNWNGVCCGGMGMMALAFYDDIPEARKLIPFVEESLGEYFKSYIHNGGGCHEGTGYWRYGMHYATRYLLSWENATGRKHPAFKITELGKSLFFPLDFTGITFGDNDSWSPSGFYFMLAKRMNRPRAALAAAARLPNRVEARTKRRSRQDRLATGDLLFAADDIPTVEEVAELRESHAGRKTPVARVYQGLGWAALADDAAFPTLRLSARGGSSKITGHGHLDLLSFKCMVNGERMITDQSGGGPVAFTNRGWDMYDRSAASKSTLFVDGIGCDTNAVCDATEVVKGKDILGIRIDGSHIYLPSWEHMFIGRVCLMVENSYWLVIDRVHSPNTADRHWMESRFHTFADCKRGKNWVSLKSGKERMMMTFAALGDAVMQESLGMPTIPGRQTTIFRWMSAKGYQDNLHVAALNPGSKKLGLTVRRDRGKGYAIEVAGADGCRRTIRLSAALKLMK